MNPAELLASHGQILQWKINLIRISLLYCRTNKSDQYECVPMKII